MAKALLGYTHSLPRCFPTQGLATAEHPQALKVSHLPFIATIINQSTSKGSGPTA